MQFSYSWARQVVVPLRAVRRWMKDSGNALSDSVSLLREQIKVVELDADCLQENVLESFVSGGEVEGLKPKDQLLASANNIKRYCTDVGVRLDELATEKISILLEAAIDGITAELTVCALSPASC